MEDLRCIVKGVTLICSLTFDQSCLASFESCFEVVSLKMAGVTKIKFVVEGVKGICECLNHSNRHQQRRECSEIGGEERADNQGSEFENKAF